MAGIRAEIAQRMGMCPSYFALAGDSPEQWRRLWHRAREAYLDNRLPALLKERLFAYLSRFSSSPYCMARHAGFLLGRGRMAGEAIGRPMEVEAVLSLLRRPVPGGAMLEAHLQGLAQVQRPWRAWPKEGSARDQWIFTALTAVFLGWPERELSLAGLRRACGEDRCRRLLALLDFIRTAHFWVETHPDLEWESDLRQMLSEIPALDEWCRGYREVVEGEARLEIRGERSGALSQTIVEGMPGNLAVVDRTGRILAVNRAWKEFAEANGAAEAPAVRTGSNYLEVCRRAAERGDATAERALRGIESVLQGECPEFVMEYPCHGPEERRWFAMSVVPLDGAANGAIISHQNVTARRVAEDALRQSETENRRQRAFLQCLLEHAGCCIAVVRGLELRYELVNPAFQALVRGEPLVGRRYREVFPEAARTGAEEQCRRVIETGETWNIDAYLAPIPGKPDATWQGQMVRLPSEEGEEPAALAVFWDFTDRVRMDRELRQARQHAEFLTGLQGELQQEPRPEKLVRVALRLLAGYLDVERAAFCIPSRDGTEWNLQEEFARDQAAPQRSFRLAEFGDEPLMQTLRAGLGVAVEDAGRDPRTRARVEDFRRLGISAWLCEPLTGAAGLKAVISLCSARPRAWREDEARLVREAAALIFAANERGLVQAALRASEERYRTLAEAAQDMIFIIGPDDTFRYVNSCAAQFLGARAEEVEGRLRSEFFPAPGSERQCQAIQRVFETGQASCVEGRLRIGERWVWLHTVLAPIRYEAGQVRAVLGIARDISERKQVEDALRKSEERYRLAVRATNDAIWEFDLTSGRESWNDNYSRLYGRSAESADSLEWWIDHLHPEDRERTVEGLRAAIDGNAETWRCEYRFLRADGEWAFVEDRACIVRDAAGTALRLFGAIHDLTARRNAEAALQASAERLQLAQRVAGLGIWDWNARTGHLDWTPEMERIFGFAPGEFPGTYEAFKARVHPDDAAEVERQREAAIRERRDFNFDYRVKLPAGEVRWVNCRGGAVYGADGSPQRVLAASMDITARKETEIRLGELFRGLQAAQGELMRKERLAALGHLAGSVAHEIRTPLAVILNDVFFLEQGSGGGNGTHPQVLDEIKRAVSHADHIITEMLDYAREPSRYTSNFRIGDAVEFARQKVGIPRQVTWRGLTPEMAGLRVRANEEQVTTVLANLLQNGVEALACGGCLLVQAAQEPPGQVCIEVRDSGRGIPPENLERIFEPLFSTKTVGIGLGLAIARRYAEHNGGNLTVESEPGEGTVFRLRLRQAE